MVTDETFEHGAAGHHFGGVVSHPSIVVRLVGFGYGQEMRVLGADIMRLSGNLVTS